MCEWTAVLLINAWSRAWGKMSVPFMKYEQIYYSEIDLWSLIRNYRVSRMWWNAIKWPRHSLEWEPFSFEGGPRHWLPFHLNLAIITSISAPPDFLYFSYISAVCLQEHRHDSSGKQTDLRTFFSSAFPSRTGMKVPILCKFVRFNSGTKNKDKGQVFQDPSLP